MHLRWQDKCTSQVASWPDSKRLNCLGFLDFQMDFSRETELQEENFCAVYPYPLSKYSYFLHLKGNFSVLETEFSLILLLDFQIDFTLKAFFFLKRLTFLQILTRRPHSITAESIVSNWEFLLSLKGLQLSLFVFILVLRQEPITCQHLDQFWEHFYKHLRKSLQIS